MNVSKLHNTERLKITTENETEERKGVFTDGGNKKEFILAIWLVEGG